MNELLRVVEWVVRGVVKHDKMGRVKEDEGKTPTTFPYNIYHLTTLNPADSSTP